MRFNILGTAGADEVELLHSAQIVIVENLVVF